MLIASITPTANPDPWRWQPHPEVWLLVIGLIAAFVYAIKVVGPQAAPEGKIISRKQIWLFATMIILLWLASDWPMHDIAEEYLYSMHMVQHMILSYFVPPLALLATPEWLFRLIVGKGRVYKALRFLSRPAVTAVTFNAMVLFTHIPAVVNRSASGGPLHYSVHVLVVVVSLTFWVGICGPAREWQISDGGKMIALFCTSLIPTIPAGWLTFAEGTVYDHYDTNVRVWGMSVLSDQQLAGGIMKLGGSQFMWILIIFIFSRRFMRGFYKQQTYKRDDAIPDAEIVGTDAPLMYSEVEEAFQRVKPPVES